MSLGYFLHRKIVQFVCEHDAPGRAKRARGLIVGPVSHV